MAQCQTCMFWDGPRPDLDDPGEHSKCLHPKVGAEDTAEVRDGAQDGESYGGIFTGPEFGCIHHQEKANEISHRVDGPV